MYRPVGFDGVADAIHALTSSSVPSLAFWKFSIIAAASIVLGFRTRGRLSSPFWSLRERFTRGRAVVSLPPKGLFIVLVGVTESNGCGLPGVGVTRKKPFFSWRDGPAVGCCLPVMASRW